MMVGRRIDEGRTAGLVPFAHEGDGGILAGLSVVVVVETLVVHLVLAPRHPLLAWTLTALSAYGLVWLFNYGRARAARPVLVGDGFLHVRVGLRHELRVPLASIASAERPAARSDDRQRARAKHHLDGARPGLANVRITLSAPVFLRSLVGGSREITSVGLRVQNPYALVAALRS